MNKLKFEYKFNFKNGKKTTFLLIVNADTMTMIKDVPEKPPKWTALENNQCPHCPLKIAETSYCPAAVSLLNIINQFDDNNSYDTLELEVITKERRISQKTTVQNAVSSLVGLLMATSGCPRAAYFKPMARYHLPLASDDETFYRSTGMYLLAQYMRNRRDLPADLELEGLKKIYNHLHEVNLHFAKRLREACKTDSSINAIVILDFFTEVVSHVLDESLDTITPLFNAYFNI